MMHWDNDKIVFSKRALLEFLKYVYDLSKQVVLIRLGHVICLSTPTLPRFRNFQVSLLLQSGVDEVEYATFGHFSKAATEAAVADLVDVRLLHSNSYYGTDSPGRNRRPNSRLPTPSKQIHSPPTKPQSRRSARG